MLILAASLLPSQGRIQTMWVAATYPAASGPHSKNTLWLITGGSSARRACAGYGALFHTFCLGYVATLISPHHGDPKKAAELSLVHGDIFSVSAAEHQLLPVMSLDLFVVALSIGVACWARAGQTPPHSAAATLSNKHKLW